MNPTSLFSTLAASLIAIVTAVFGSSLRAADSAPRPHIVFQLSEYLGALRSFVVRQIENTCPANMPTRRLNFGQQYS
jgi:hypothetical protein